MKNRIWKQMKKAGIVTVLAGAMLGGTIEPELTLGADFLPGQAPFIDQSVFWKDIESGQAELGIRIRGLNEWLSGRRFSEDKEKNEKWDDELQKIEDPSVEQEKESEQELPEDDLQQEKEPEQELPEDAAEAEYDTSAESDRDADEKQNGKTRKKIRKLESEIEKLTDERDSGKKQLAEANDKYMRLFAEYDNFRKRSAKEREGVYADAYIDALTQILPILDNLERAAQFSDEDAETPMAKGLALTLKSFEEVLSKMGVKEIEALGKNFDPNLHNAVMHIEDENYGENEIVEVFMKGYIRGEKVLRHSMVKVAN